MTTLFRTVLTLIVAVLLASSCARINQLSELNAVPDIPPSPTPNIPKVPEARPDAELQRQIEKIAAEAKGKVGVYAIMVETGDAAGLNEGGQFPMQSVYKLPISMAVMEQVRAGNLNLDEKVGVAKSDFVSAGQYSPIRDKNPNGTELSVKELIRFAVSESDGTASDVLMDQVGGPTAVQAYLMSIGVTDIKVVNSEKEMAQDWGVQYKNWATPKAAVELLTKMRDWSHWNDGPDESGYLLTKFMAESKPGAKRLKGLLPAGTVVAHKTGTSGNRDGITAATNDIGVFTLPNKKHVAIAVFVSDSPADEKTRENVIAKVAKTVWDRWNK
jgi:beta-lactamase class A